jgi:hypothetical protein
LRPQHDAVVRPGELIAAPESRAARVNEWLAGHLAVVFGLAWTVWVFMAVPLLVLLAPAGVRSVVFYLASGWIQLWALPLFVFTGNRLQAAQDAQSEAQHTALTHIAWACDKSWQIAEKTYDLVAPVPAAAGTGQGEHAPPAS